MDSLAAASQECYCCEFGGYHDAVAAPRVSLVLLVLLNLFRAPAWAQAPTGLSITIVEGEGAINNIRQRVNREPIVQVEDQNHKPIAGAVVVFLLPDQGASGTFPDGSRMLMAVTDNQGRAIGPRHSSQ